MFRTLIALALVVPFTAQARPTCPTYEYVGAAGARPDCLEITTGHEQDEYLLVHNTCEQAVQVRLSGIAVPHTLFFGNPDSPVEVSPAGAWEVPAGQLTESTIGAPPAGEDTVVLVVDWTLGDQSGTWSMTLKDWACEGNYPDDPPPAEPPAADRSEAGCGVAPDPSAAAGVALFLAAWWRRRRGLAR